MVAFDITSTYMNAKMTLEILIDEMRSNAKIIDDTLIEAVVTSVVESSIGKSKEEIKESLKQLSLGKIP